MANKQKIIYTWTDEAPALATRAFLPIIQAISGAAGVEVDTRDISVAGRIIAAFPENLTEVQKQGDHLAELGRLTADPATNIIKLPNISASVPQLKAAIAELQAHGYKIPNLPEDPQTEEEHALAARFSKIKGSAVNPVLREGNSDRRAPKAVKEFARKHPHRMGKWEPTSKTHVSSMSDGDFFGSEKSTTLDAADDVRIEHVGADGKTTVLKASTPLLAGEIIDAATLNKNKLRAFLEEQINDAKDKDVLFSLHLKATMMKVSDPIIFGHAVEVYYKDVFNKYADTFKRLGVNSRNGLGDVYTKIQELPEAERQEIEQAIQDVYKTRPGLAMVNSDKGITNLHVPSDIIIDASMPAALRDGGKMWTADNKQADMKAVIPDRSYAGVYQAVVTNCREHGALDPTKMGTVPNVGLMAKKAEEYGSHDKTFEAASAGTIRVVGKEGKVYLEQPVEEGDIFRMCQTKDAPTKDWVKLAVSRARATGWPAVFWLSPDRAHDQQVKKKVEKYLPEFTEEGKLDIQIMDPVDACKFSLDRMRGGENTISVTGNVLRDYNTDLFPILEVGTSAKMLSIVPLMAGGGLFETGAGGSAPKHVQQFQEEGHLRWDSLGEFMALAASLDHLGTSFNNKAASLLGNALDDATTKLLENNKSPSRKVNEIDNRGSQYYLALYWAQALAAQDEDKVLQARCKKLAQQLGDNEAKITSELLGAQGKPQDLGGYYHVDSKKATAAMRPSATLNAIFDEFANDAKQLRRSRL